MVQCSALKLSVVQCSVLKLSVVQCSVLKLNVVQCSVLKLSVVQCLEIIATLFSPIYHIFAPQNAQSQLPLHVSQHKHILYSNISVT